MSDLANITVATFNRLECSKICLQSLRATTRSPYALTVVDNGSQDGTREYLVAEREAGRIHRLVLLERNMGVACAYNLGWSLTPAAYYLKVDNDVEFLREDWLDALLQHAREVKEVAMLGFGCNTSGLTLKTAGDDALHYCGHAGGLCLLRADVHERLGFWNEDYGLYGEEDSDFGLRARLAGYVNALVCQRERPYIQYVDHVDSRRDAYTTWKGEQRRRNVRAAFLFNDALFKSGLRELYVGRKYVAIVEGERCAFLIDKEYLRRVSDLHKQYGPHLQTIVDSPEFQKINDELGFNFWY